MGTSLRLWQNGVPWWQIIGIEGAETDFSPPHNSTDIFFCSELRAHCIAFVNVFPLWWSQEWYVHNYGRYTWPTRESGEAGLWPGRRTLLEILTYVLAVATGDDSHWGHFHVIDRLETRLRTSKICLTGHSRVLAYEEVKIPADTSDRMLKVKKIIGILLVKHVSRSSGRVLSFWSDHLVSSSWSERCGSFAQVSAEQGLFRTK